MPSLARLLQELRRPDAYFHPVDEVRVHQTHISVVFVAGAFAYKLKKPVDLGFVDYSSLDKRLHYCRRELELNRRLADDVYLDVVPIIDDGGLCIETDTDGHDAVEWAVRMARLDEDNTLRKRLADRRVPPDTFSRLGHHMARFHNHADRGSHIDTYASFEVVEKNALDNFEQTRPHLEDTVDPGVFTRLEQCFRDRLSALSDLIDERAGRGVARDTHGDLRLEHVYIGDDDTLRIVDCIEFNDAFRYADPISDIAFLAMDLGFRGYDEEADTLLDAYFTTRDDDQGRQLIDFYVAYRSCVRAKVHSLKAADDDVDRGDRQHSRNKARAHWLYALARIEDPNRAPLLVVLAGLPASGKSTLGRTMQQRGDIDVMIESDVVRKELAGIPDGESAAADFGRGIYTPEWTDRTYTELTRRAEEALACGQRVAVAATFVDDQRRRQIIEAGRRMGVPVRFIECVVSDQEARKRLANRRDDPSDANLEVYQQMKRRRDEPSSIVRRVYERRRTE